jgi:hypothetical protein
MYNPHVAELNREALRAEPHFREHPSDRSDWWNRKAHEYAALADGLEHSLSVARRRASVAEADAREAAITAALTNSMWTTDVQWEANARRARAYPSPRTPRALGSLRRRIRAHT